MRFTAVQLPEVAELLVDRNGPGLTGKRSVVRVSIVAASSGANKTEE
jgi:hypothetical protein